MLVKCVMGVGEKKFKVCRKDVRKEKNIIIIEAVFIIIIIINYSKMNIIIIYNGVKKVYLIII